MRGTNDRIENLKIMAHPVRVKILEELMKGVKCVSDLQEFLETSQPNLSQHLSMLKAHGIIDFFVDGRLKCYFLVDPIVPDILKILGNDYQDPMPPPECCPVTRKGTYPGARKH